MNIRIKVDLHIYIIALRSCNNELSCTFFDGHSYDHLHEHSHEHLVEHSCEFSDIDPFEY